MTTEQKLKQEYDSPWKNVLDKFFKEFMQLLFPDYHALINWNITPEMLDKELAKVTHDAANRSKIVDKLVKVTLLDGNLEYICIHIEIQATKKLDFAARMFSYYCFIFSKHGKPIISLAVLLDTYPKWRPNTYQIKIHNTRMTLEFNIAKILDFRTRIAELEESKNPFAVVILAQLAVMRQDNCSSILTTKKEIIRLLYSRGFDKATTYAVMAFINWVIQLPAGLDRECNAFIDEIDRGSNMEYIPTFVRDAWEQGLAQGLENGKTAGIVDGRISMLIKQLEYKFRFVADAYRDTLRNYSAEQLLDLSARLLDANSIEQVFAVREGCVE